MELMCVDDIVILVIERTRFEFLKVFVDLPDGFGWFRVSIHETGHIDGMMPLVAATVLLQNYLSSIVHELNQHSRQQMSMLSSWRQNI
jgi:hypothetical protein